MHAAAHTCEFVKACMSEGWLKRGRGSSCPLARVRACTCACCRASTLIRPCARQCAHMCTLPSVMKAGWKQLYRACDLRVLILVFADDLR
eukprot:6206171-Pleurochrysis_carterae.AAC.1